MFGRKKATHQHAQRHGERIGYLWVSVYLKDGKLSFRTKVTGSFEPFENDEIVAEIIRLENQLAIEEKSNSDSYFDVRPRKSAS